MLNQIFTAPFYRKGLPESRLQSNLKEKSYLNTMTKEFPVFNFLTPKKKQSKHCTAGKYGSSISGDCNLQIFCLKS